MRSLIEFVRRILGLVSSNAMKPDRCKRLLTCIRCEDKQCCRDLEAGRHGVSWVQAEREMWSI
jgi:hypothetical protein